jgi:hypothetical protein
MSDQNTTDQNTTTDKAAKVTKRHSLSSVVNDVAKARKMNATDAGKRTRAYIRGNRDTLVKVWPGLKNHSKGDRYPDMPTKARRQILDSIGKGK